MKMTFSKKLLLIFSVIAAVSYSVLWACGWSDWDEYGVSAYSPEAFVDSTYKPFFYSDQFYYEIGHDNAHVSRFNDKIVAEWETYLGVSSSDTEVSYFLLRASATLVDSIYKLSAKSLPEHLSAMQLVKNKSQKKVAAFFEFLTYAKANESYAATFHEYWNYDEKATMPLLNEKQLSDRLGMEKKMKSTTDNFLAQRYFFQIIRSYFFGAEYAQCLSFYESNKSKFPSNTLAVRTLSYIAGCYYKQKNYAMANYLFSKVYDAGADFKTVAHFSFHPQNDADWKQTLALCENKNEQITLWHLLGIYFDEMKAIEEIYALNPQSEKLELLLARLINLQEIKSNKETTEYGSGNYRPGKDSLDKGALKLVTKIADEGNTAKPFMWLLSAGYLHFINEDYSKAKYYYSKAEKVLPTNNELAKAQVRLFILMNNVAATTTLDAERESLLLKDLVWLQSLSTQPIPALRYAYAYEWIKNILAEKYKKQNEHLRSEMFVHKDTFYTKPAMVANMKAFLLNRKASAFDQYCKTIYQISVSDISEYQYIVLTYEDKIEEALTLFSLSDSATDGGTLLGNPFNGSIKDCHDCDHAAHQKIKYTKISLLQKMKVMKENVAAGNDVYNNALLLGNAFYNITHYGNARFFYECTVIGSGHSSPDALSKSFRKALLSQSLAKKYYQKAFAAAATDEQKAKLTYLLLKCERNDYYNKALENGTYDGWGYAAVPAIDFSVLFPFKSTKYYEDVIAECGYFKEYSDRKIK